jgi:hypothetical protein
MCVVAAAAGAVVFLVSAALGLRPCNAGGRPRNPLFSGDRGVRTCNLVVLILVPAPGAKKGKDGKTKKPREMAKTPKIKNTLETLAAPVESMHFAQVLDSGGPAGGLPKFSFLEGPRSKRTQCSETPGRALFII